MTDVFLFANQSLFGSAIKHLLDDDPDLQVVGWEDNLELAAHQIQAKRPSVIVVVVSNPSGMTNSRERLGSGTARVVTVNLEDSVVVASTGETALIEDVGVFIGKLRDRSPALDQEG